jgi:hypothetical protein
MQLQDPLFCTSTDVATPWWLIDIALPTISNSGHVADCLIYTDAIYTQSWQDALEECKTRLGRTITNVLCTSNPSSTSVTSWESLLTECPDDSEQSRKAIMLIHPRLDHYETLAQNFVNTAMMWGLLFLVSRAS